jgi:hypothetical protein
MLAIFKIERRVKMQAFFCCFKLSKKTERKWKGNLFFYPNKMRIMEMFLSGGFKLYFAVSWFFKRA